MAHCNPEGERYYLNPYIGLESQIVLESPHQAETNLVPFREELAKSAQKLLMQWQTLLTLKPDAPEDHSVYTGATGVILTFWHLIESGILAPTPEVTEKLDGFVHRAVSNTNDMLKRRRFTFLCGDAGPLVIALLLSKDPSERVKLKRSLLDLQSIALNDTGRDGSETPNELLYGRVGYLYALLFLNEKCGNDPKDDRLIDSSIISPVVSKILGEGMKHKEVDGPPLHYEWHGKQYLGAAHGYTGILYILLKMKDTLDPKETKAIRQTLDWMLTSQRFSSGNLRSSVGSDRDKLVHWCHGAPGAVYLYVEAAKVYKDERYLKAAVEFGHVVWNRGILKTSYSLCHGVAGNAYSLMALYKYTKDEIWLKRSCLLARWCFSWGSRVSRNPDRPNSLFEGLGGSVYMLHDFLGFLQDPENHHRHPQFPGFELE